MIKLKTKSLNDFLKKASAITSNSILPIHGYLRLQYGTLSKTNGRIFLCESIEVPHTAETLLEEAAFSAFVKFTKAEEIEIKIEPVKGSNDSKITLTDGSVKQSFQVPPIKDFDNLPEFDEENAVELDGEVLQAIGIAASCTSNIGGGTNFDFVFLNDNIVFATDRYKLYTKKINGLPNAYFDTDCARVISQLNSVSFCSKGKFNLFKSGNVLYGFQQFGDVKAPNVKPFIEKGLVGDYFEFEASDFLRFCELVIASIPTNGKDVTVCEMKGGELYCNKEEYGKEVKMNIPFSGDYKPTIRFNPKFHAPYIRSLGAPTIRFYEFPKTGVFVGDLDEKDFVGMISSLL